MGNAQVRRGVGLRLVLEEASGVNSKLNRPLPLPLDIIDPCVGLLFEEASGVSLLRRRAESGGEEWPTSASLGHSLEATSVGVRWF